MITFIGLMLITIIATAAETRTGKIAEKVNLLNQQQVFTTEYHAFDLAGINSDVQISATVKNYALLNVNKVADEILNLKPDYLKLTIPGTAGNGKFTLLLFKEEISPDGLSLLTSDGRNDHKLPDMVHYRGMIMNDNASVAAVSFAKGEVMGLFSNSKGNFVLGKMENKETDIHILYNDQDLVAAPSFSCGTNTAAVPENHSKDFEANKSSSIKCVNWYWETDVDIYNNKGSVANVTTYMNGIFNQVSTLYANDGMGITLQTLFVWNTTDPYTGPSTSNYLNQFGTHRTSFAGDLANLFGFQGNGGVAYVNGFCDPTPYKMAYCGISSSFQTVPTYSWTVEVTAHEEGHLFGSHHTHDCAWNGNNTKIDACGDAAGYVSGSCAQTVPALPVDGGTIMSYCHLTNAGINLSLGFGPQPATRMLNYENNATCLSACSGCPTPAQPGTINGTATVCQSVSQTYSISSVSGATSYTWTLPSGWSGSSTTTSISVTPGSSGGNITVKANNNCGSSPVKSLPVNVASIPSPPGIIAGNTSICQSSTNLYTISTVAGATSYTWTLPSGWSGTSTTASISATAGNSGGNITVKANSACGSSSVRTLSISTQPLPSLPGSISAIGGNSKVCPGDTRSYHINTVSGATSYTWIIPAGVSITSGQGTNNISVSFGQSLPAHDSIWVKANNSCGSSGTRAIRVLRNNPVKPSVISGPTAGLCNATAVGYSVNAVPGMTYNWSFSTTAATIAAGQGTSSVLANYASGFTSGILIVSASNACGTGIQRTINIKSIPAMPAAISGPAAVCANQVGVPYSVTPVQGAVSYTWAGPSGTRFSDGVTTSVTNALTTTSANVTVNFKTTAGNIRVKANSACGSSANRYLAVSFNCREGLLNNEENLSVFPNPAHDMMTVQFNLETNSSYTLDVMDLTGRQLLSVPGISPGGMVSVPLPVSTFAKGMYFIRLASGDSRNTLRFTVE